MLHLKQGSSTCEFWIGNDQDFLRMEHADMVRHKDLLRLQLLRVLVSKASCWSLWHRRCLGDDAAWIEVWWWLAYWLWLRLRRCRWFWRFGAKRWRERCIRRFCRRLFTSPVLLPAFFPAFFPVLQCSAAKL